MPSDFCDKAQCKCQVNCCWWNNPKHSSIRLHNLELGTFFADLWKERKVPSIFETHSANTILRLRKLISQGKLSPSDVSLAYFHVADVPRERGDAIKAVVVKNLDVNADGTLERGLPMEFFGADLQEALDFGEDSGAV